MISSIRTWMFNKSLQKHQNYKQIKDFSGVNICNSVCILSNGSNPQSKLATEKYRTRLESLNKTVEVLYFIDANSDADDGYSRQSIKWNGVPQHEVIDVFLSKQYDLLIFLNPIMEDHLKYLAILCNAKFKIGPDFKKNSNIFDLMIDIKDYSDTDSLIKNIDKQLRQLSI